MGLQTSFFLVTLHASAPAQARLSNFKKPTSQKVCPPLVGSSQNSYIWLGLFTPVCLFVCGVFPSAGPTDVHGTKHSWDPRPTSRRQQQRLQLPFWLQHQL